MTTTLEALQKLTGAELNVRVARKLGWEKLTADGWISPEYRHIVKGLPDWAGDVGAAWQLVENMSKEKYLELRRFNSLFKMNIHDDVMSLDGKNKRYSSEWQSIASRAIVLAFLLAAGEGA